MKFRIENKSGSVLKGTAMVLGVILLIVACFALWTLVAGLFVMWAFALLHMVFPGVPPIGYWDSCLVALALGILGSFFKSTTTRTN